MGLACYVCVTESRKANVLRYILCGRPTFLLKGEKSRSPDVKNLKKLPHIYMCILTGGGSSAGGSVD